MKKHQAIKMSVSVPDNLWTAAKAIRPDKGTSSLLQEALAEFVSNHRNEIDIEKLLDGWLEGYSNV